MVDTQVRPSDVTKFPIIQAMLTVPREAFVPVERREVAYVGECVDLGAGRVMLEPRTLAKMLDAVDIRPGDLVLDVGSGLGYSSAVISQLAEAVVALEENEDFSGEAERLLAENNADNAFVVTAPLAQGATKHGPYDVITVQGGIEKFPESLSEQLKDGGRAVAIFVENALGICRVGYKSAGVISWRYSFNANAPLLAGFEHDQAFAL